MHLCTLHPSLSALAHNLELGESLACAQLDLALLQKLDKAELLPGYFAFAKQADAEVKAQSFDLRPLSGKEDVTASIEADTLCLTSESFILYDKTKEALLDRCLTLGIEPRVLDPRSLSQILDNWQDLGKEFGKQARARDLRQRVEAQLMDWTSNFYARLRGKRVLIVSGFSPLVIASSWINDIVRRIGAIAPEIDSDTDQLVIDWDFVAKFDPHVILFAPVGATLLQSTKLFFELDGHDWKGAEVFHATSAAKRGDIFFCSGQSNFYSQDYRIIDSIGTIVSAAAGLDSGYITERDSFYKIRFLELHRHKFV
jgi:hypothetical protein